jgi:hypothetical protein
LTILYLIWKNIGKKKKYFGFILKTDELESVFNIDCQKTTVGLFFGMIVLLCTIVSNILYFILKKNTVNTSATNSTQKNVSIILRPDNVISETTVLLEFEEDSGLLIIEILELVLISVSGLTTIATIIRTKNLAKMENISHKFDEFLGVISLCGIYIYSIFSSISIIYTDNRSYTGYIVLTISIVSMIETTLQVYLVLDGLKRRAISEKDRMEKPGRGLFTLLIIVNLCLWISDTFVFKRFDVNQYQLKYFSVLAWSIINTISSPLAIFFRFHVSVCLSDCWKSIYL